MSKRSSIIAMVFIVLGVTIVIGYLSFSIWSFSSLDKDVVCKDLHIQLLNNSTIKLITQTEVSKILDNKDLNPIGKTFKRIKTESIEAELLKNPMIKSVECFKTPSGDVFIEVLQPKPKFIVAGLESYYIDTDRKVLPISLNYAAYVPVVSGIVSNSFAKGELFDFITYLELDPFWNAQIEQIYVREDKKIELIPRVGDAVIILGTLDNFEQKLKNLYKLYSHGFNVMGWNRYEKIDLQFKNQIVCTKTGTEHTQLKTEETLVNDSSIVKVL